MDPHLMSSLVILLLIACGVTVITDFFKLPYTIALVIVGLMVALFGVTPNIHLTYDVTFTLVLPPLLFYGAMHMDLEHLKENWKPIVMLAIPGVVVSTFLIGYALHILWGIELMYALLFGALITPTDPISVLAILKSIGAPERLRTILEGESLFNDGTGVVVFAIILGLVTGHDSFNLSGTLVEFVKVAGGGTIIGLIVGIIAYAVLKRLNDHLLEVALTVALTFGTPLLAEHFHLSGIIAIVVAGMIIGNYGKTYSMSDKTRETLESFWEVIDFIINSLLFLVIGVELQDIPTAERASLLVPTLMAIGTLLVARGIVVYPVVWIKNMISHNDIPWKWAHVLFWGGLKGSISIALVLGLPEDFVYRNLFLSVAFAIVLFTLIVQGLTIRPLILKLKINQ